jgi:hypothetical protein
MWQNDVSRQLPDRVEHLLAKCECWPNTRYVWIVGDSSDGTSQALVELSTGYDNVQIVDIGSTGIDGGDERSRLRRLSATANEYFHWTDGADYIVIHESDIRSPHDLIPRLVANAERGICPVAAWPTLEIAPGRSVFYDVWAFRKNGMAFTNQPPYHACYRPTEPFQVDSFGTLFLMHGEDGSLIHMQERAVLDLCQQLREQGRTLWVDPRIVCEQPHSLWRSRQVVRQDETEGRWWGPVTPPWEGDTHD